VIRSPHYGGVAGVINNGLIGVAVPRESVGFPLKTSVDTFNEIWVMKVVSSF